MQFLIFLLKTFVIAVTIYMLSIIILDHLIPHRIEIKQVNNGWVIDTWSR